MKSVISGLAVGALLAACAMRLGRSDVASTIRDLAATDVCSVPKDAVPTVSMVPDAWKETSGCYEYRTVLSSLHGTQYCFETLAQRNTALDACTLLFTEKVGLCALVLMNEESTASR